MAKVDIGSLTDLDEFDRGKLGEAFKIELGSIIADLRIRPSLYKARALEVKLEFYPHADDTGELEDVEIRAAIKATRPARRTRAVSATAMGSHSLSYDDLSPTETGQGTLSLDAVAWLNDPNRH